MYGTLDAVAGRFPPAAGERHIREAAGACQSVAENEATDQFVAFEIAWASFSIGERRALPRWPRYASCCCVPIVWERRDEEWRRRNFGDARGADDGGEALVASVLAKARATIARRGRICTRVEARPRAGRTSVDDGAGGRVFDNAGDQRGSLEIPQPSPAWLELQARRRVIAARTY